MPDGRTKGAYFNEFEDNWWGYVIAILLCYWENIRYIEWVRKYFHALVVYKSNTN